jgi:hypothetical protein
VRLTFQRLERLLWSPSPVSAAFQTRPEME